MKSPVIILPSYTKDSDNSFWVRNNKISGHAVEQSTILEKLMQEMFGPIERITTISRREILRQQVYETLFQSEIDSSRKSALCEQLNTLFAGQYRVTINKQISFVDFENEESSEQKYEGDGIFVGNKYDLHTIGSKEIQSIVSAIAFVNEAVGQREEEEDESGEQTATDTTVSSEDAISEPQRISESNEADEEDTVKVNSEEIVEKCNRLNKVLRDYSISALPLDPKLVQEAARFTRFTVELKSGETIRSIPSQCSWLRN